MTLIDKLNEAYQEPPNSEPWFPRASGCGGCLREMAHLAAGFPARPQSPESLRVFELGHQRGAELARRLKEFCYPDAELEAEVFIPLPGGKYTMAGHVDVWIPSIRTIIDFKTAGGFKAGLLVKGEEGAGEDYEMQLQAYRHGIRHRNCMDLFIKDAERLKMAALDVIRCVLIFEAKDSDARRGVQAGQLIEVEVPHTPELEERFQQRLRALAKILEDRDSGTLDPASAPGVYDTDGSWRCKVKDGKALYCKIGPMLGKCAG